jgi:hypothetical protein
MFFCNAAYWLRGFNSIDGYGSKSNNSDLAGFYLLLYIRQHAGLFRRRTNVNDVFENKKIVSCQ